jgi:hypothetical protein
MFQIDTSRQKPFSIYAAISKAYEGDNGNWIIEGPLSNPSKDLQGETMRMAGLMEGLDTFHKIGSPVDWDHLWERTRDPDYLIGKGLDTYLAPHPRTGIEVPSLRAELCATKEFAQKARRHYEAGLPLGFSVAGLVESRDPVDKAIIVKPMVTSVAVTPVPVVSENTGCIAFVKSVGEATERLAKGGPASIRDLKFPLVPETRYLVDPLFRALDVSPGLPHSGPGASALAVEDLDGYRQKKRKRKRRFHRSLSPELILPLLIAEHLADVCNRS